MIYIVSLYLYRRGVKSKAAAVKKKREQTGVGYTNIKDLDDIDKRVISLMQVDTIDGDGDVQERGLVSQYVLVFSYYSNQF